MTTIYESDEERRKLERKQMAEPGDFVNNMRLKASRRRAGESTEMPIRGRLNILKKRLARVRTDDHRIQGQNRRFYDERASGMRRWGLIDRLKDKIKELKIRNAAKSASNPELSKRLQKAATAYKVASKLHGTQARYNKAHPFGGDLDKQNRYRNSAIVSGSKGDEFLRNFAPGSRRAFWLQGMQRRNR